MDLTLTQVRSLLLPLAYQQVTPVNLVALYKTLYATDGLDLQKSDAVSRALELAKKKVDAPTLKSLFSELYATFGVDLPKKAAQMQAMELALSGANSTQLKLAYQAFRNQGKKQADALQAAIPEAIAAGFQGLARRHAADAMPYTAVEFQKHFGSQWVSSWESAPQEERVAQDQKAYTIGEFIQYFKDSWYWTQAKTATQKRLADDGHVYTMEEFKQYYTSQWQQKWMVADVLPCAECTTSEQLIAAETKFASSKTCPGSAAWIHASCEVSVTFPSTQCADVQAEAEARMAAQGGWRDPHNGGTYANRSPATASLIQGKHITGSSQHYEDHFNLAFEQNGGDCKLSGCSESQVTSVLDFSTNFCNMHDLYCGSQDKCKVVKSDFKYTEAFGSCKQHDSSKCMIPPSVSKAILI